MLYKRTKIVCTIGPSSWDYPTLKELAKNGMDLVRLNLSHGTHEEKAQQIRFIRQIAQKAGKHLAIIADLQGPKLRLGKIEGILTITKGDVLKLSAIPKEGALPIQFDFSPYIKAGERVLLNDGLVEFKVLHVKAGVVEIEALNNGWVSSNKGINIPDTHLNSAAFTPKDAEDTEFAIKQNVDYIALSFVQTADDITHLQDIISSHKSNTKVIAKIETKEAVDNLEAIIKATNAIMIARGDLASETKAEEVPLIQQKIIRLARQNQKPVIVATQMLESMTENPRPTRAEVSDVANAVLDEADAVMLSGETASGKYPVEAVKTMNQVILSVEKNPEYKKYIKINWENISLENLSTSAIAASAASMAYRINAKAIVAATSAGRTVRLVSSFRPSSPIIAIAHDEQTCNQLTLMWGVTAIQVPSFKSSDIFWKNIAKKVKAKKLAQKGDKIVLVGGTKIGVTGATDTIKVITL